MNECVKFEEINETIDEVKKHLTDVIYKTALNNVGSEFKGTFDEMLEHIAEERIDGWFDYVKEQMIKK